ncbi:hypothetical protein SEA_MAGRITTE_208 [Microbacterium phage Magritte]|nr:hypothetical protein SEA_MAGRITTE_208 [Microbacterium phage Magritte]
MRRSQDPRVVKARQEIDNRSYYGSQYGDVSAIIDGFHALDNGPQGPTEEETAKALLEWLTAQGYSILPPKRHEPIMRGDRAKIARAFAERSTR